MLLSKDDHIREIIAVVEVMPCEAERRRHRPELYPVICINQEDHGKGQGGLLCKRRPSRGLDERRLIWQIVIYFTNVVLTSFLPIGIKVPLDHR